MRVPTNHSGVGVQDSDDEEQSEARQMKTVHCVEMHPTTKTTPFEHTATKTGAPNLIL
jgi:hypothetical protein